LDTFEATTVFDTPALLQDLYIYTEERQNILVADDLEGFGGSTVTANRSVLFLRVNSAANFYTTDNSLMQDPPPVYADISTLSISVPHLHHVTNLDTVLDPYLLNIFPQSLLPTAAYIIVLAVASWFLSGFAWSKLQTFVQVKQRSD
jgi:hypothetical protein